MTDEHIPAMSPEAKIDRLIVMVEQLATAVNRLEELALRLSPNTYFGVRHSANPFDITWVDKDGIHVKAQIDE